MGAASLELDVIRADDIYPLEVFKRRTGLGDWALRKLRRKGLRVVRIGNRSFVQGREFLRLVEDSSDGGNAGAIAI